MALNLEYFTAAGTAVADGVFIPIADFATGGLLPGELAAALTEEEKEGKTIFAIHEIFAKNTIPTDPNSPNILTDKLGISITKGNFVAGTGPNLMTQPYTISWQVVGNSADNSYWLLKAPTTGSFATSSILAFTTVFPGAVKVAAAGAVPGEGVLIPNVQIDRYGGPTFAALDLSLDCRDYISGLLNFIGGEVEERTTTTASAVTQVSNTTDTAFVLPDEAFDSTNPTTGLDPLDRVFYLTVTRSYTITFETIVVNAAKFDVNVIKLI